MVWTLLGTHLGDFSACKLAPSKAWGYLVKEAMKDQQVTDDFDGSGYYVAIRGKHQGRNLTMSRIFNG